MADTPPQQHGGVILPPSSSQESNPFEQHAQQPPFSQPTSQDDDQTRMGPPAPLLRRAPLQRPAPLPPPLPAVSSASSATDVPFPATGSPTQRINPTQMPVARPQRQMGAFELRWRNIHEWMIDQREEPESWLRWLTLYFPALAVQVIPTHSIWLMDEDVLRHAHGNLMRMLQEHRLIKEGEDLFPADLSFSDMMGPPSFHEGTRAACLAWTQMVGPLRKLQGLTHVRAVQMEATMAMEVAEGALSPRRAVMTQQHHQEEDEEDDDEHEEDEEEEMEIIAPPQRRPRGRPPAAGKKQVRLAAPEEEDEEEEMETQ